MSSKLTQKQLQDFSDNLSQFTGTETWHRHGLIPDILYTDGAKYVAETLGAYWLLDTIAISQLMKSVRAEEFQVWTLKVPEGEKPVIECSDGNENIIFRNRLSYTDFPLSEMTLWFTNNVILLPSEY